MAYMSSECVIVCGMTYLGNWSGTNFIDVKISIEIQLAKIIRWVISDQTSFVGEVIFIFIRSFHILNMWRNTVFLKRVAYPWVVENFMFLQVGGPWPVIADATQTFSTKLCSYVQNALGKFLYVCFYRRQNFMWYIFTYFKIIPFWWYNFNLF